MKDDKSKGFDPTRIIPKRDHTPAKGPSLRAHLVLLTGDKAGTTYLIKDDRMTIIGRQEFHILLTDPDGHPILTSPADCIPTGI